MGDIDSALVQALEMRRIERPARREINLLREWLVRPIMGNQFLNGIEQTVWEESNDPDLVSLFPRQLERDTFTVLLEGVLLDVYHRIWGRRNRRKVRCHPPFVFEWTPHGKSYRTA